jgi:hypothetical protein
VLGRHPRRPVALNRGLRTSISEADGAKDGWGWWIADIQARSQHRWMSEHVKIQLSRLRAIGWSHWDPIGLREISDGEWQDGGACADEYDGYLLQVAGRLRKGERTSDVVAYLEGTETGHIGLTQNATMRSRAEATVAAIQEYLATLPPGPLKVR